MTVPTYTVMTCAVLTSTAQDRHDEKTHTLEDLGEELASRHSPVEGPSWAAEILGKKKCEMGRNTKVANCSTCRFYVTVALGMDFL